MLNGAAVRRWGCLGRGANYGIGVHRSNGDGNSVRDRARVGRSTPIISIGP